MMRVTLPLLLFVSLLFVGVHIVFQPQQSKKSLVIQPVKVANAADLLDPTATLLPKEVTPTPSYYAPAQLSIPTIALTARIVPVGLTETHTMDVPNNFVDVGWYDLGYKPGQKGSTVLDGHYDNFHGQPAVFYYLDTLTKGDHITVTDDQGKQFTYIVTDNEVYPVNGLPNQQIYASTDAVRLNIITCHGYYDPNIQTFTQRDVIYAVLQRSNSSH